MNKDSIAWVCLLLVFVAVAFAVFKHYNIAWGVIALNVVLLAYVVRKR